jgi:hypothetical protein
VTRNRSFFVIPISLMLILRNFRIAYTREMSVDIRILISVLEYCVSYLEFGSRVVYHKTIN